MKQLTISFLDHFIHFRSAAEADLIAVPDDYVCLSDDNLDLCFKALTQGNHVWVWYRHSIKEIVHYIFSNYRYVKAAGGLAQAADGSQLLISREGHWDIPKGMVEPGERIAQAAIREVEEETGITNLTLGPLITKTYHIYDKYGGWHIKQTSWYHISTPSAAATTPQLEEGITQAEWVSPQQCKQLLSHSFASLSIISQHLK